MYRVLVIDDDLEIIELVRHSLPTEDYAISAASGSQEAQNKIMAQKFDAILLDINLPGNDGISLLKYFHSIGITKVTPVLMLTGSASKEHVLAASANGSQGYIRKPFKPKTLQDQLSRALSLRDIEHAAQANVKKNLLIEVEPEQLFTKIIIYDRLSDRIVREIFTVYEQLANKWPIVALDLRTQPEITSEAIMQIKMLRKLMRESRLFLLAGKNFGDLIGVFPEEDVMLVISEIDLRRLLRSQQKNTFPENNF